MPVLLCPPQIPHGLSPISNLAFGSKRLANNNVSHGKMLRIKITLDFRMNFIPHTKHIVLPI